MSAATAARADGADVRWDVVGDEALELLRRYLRFPTVNEPSRLDARDAAERPWRAGCEAEAVEWLAGVLRADGVDAERLTAAPGRVNLVARLAGRGPGGPVTLLSHSDVVSAARAEWDGGIDPFGAEVHGGFVYGRGTLDLKGLGIAHLIVFLLLHRLRIPLRRDVVLLVAADEETGGRFGAEWLLRQRPELLRTGVVLGEGAYSLRGAAAGQRAVHAIAVGEKGCLEVELTVDLPSHHSGMHGGEGAPARLVRALERLQRMNLPERLTPPTRALFRALAAAGPLPRAVRPLAGVLVRHHLPRRSAVVRAMLRDTVALTVLESGHKPNVVPARARAVLSIRYLPGTDPDALVQCIREAVRDPGVDVRALHHKEAAVSAFDTPEFHVLSRHAAASEPGALAAPILSPGASDCRHWRYAGVHGYGWVPFVLPAADLHGVHGPNERVSLSAFGAGIRTLFNAVAELAAA